MRVAFFNLEPWQEERVRWSDALKGAGVEPVFVEGSLGEEHLPEDRSFEALSIFVDRPITGRVLEEFPNLKFITTRSTGFDHIDCKAAAKRGVVVANVPSYGENTVAEYAFALLLALSRKVYDAYDRVRETGSFNLAGLRGFDLKGKTLGVVGTGHIGRHVVRIAQGFDMRVTACDARPDGALARELGFSYRSLDDLLGESDIVTLHVPHMESTHHLINADRIARMKRGAYLVNTSRGGVVDTNALVDALREGHIAGAALDVLEEEGAIKDEMHFLAHGHPKENELKTLLENHILIDLPNVIITSHNAFNTVEAIDRILTTTIENIVAFTKGKPINLVSI